MYHTCLVVFTDDIEGQGKYSYDGKTIPYFSSSNSHLKHFTVGAGGDSLGFLGKLKADFNRTTARKLSTASELNKIQNLSVNHLEKILKMAKHYINMSRNKLPNYTAFPNKKSKGAYYNCNSFTKGLLDAAKIPCIKPPRTLPGWTKPLPRSYFGI